MTLAFDLPSRRDSPLARLDPRWKLAASLLGALTASLLQNPLPAALALALVLPAAALSRVPPRWLARRLAVVAFVVGFFVIWLPFFPAANDQVVSVLNLSVSVEGCLRAAVLLMRTLALVTWLLVLWATTDDADLFKAAHTLYVPGLFVQLTALTYRYVFVLGDEFVRLRIALRVRGYRNRMSRHCYRTIGQVAGSLIVSSHDRAERVAHAMRCRGFDGQYRSLHSFRTRAVDVAIFLGVTVAMAGILAWDWFGR
jgi:cobalt/nickel transport system permease protein